MPPSLESPEKAGAPIVLLTLVLVHLQPSSESAPPPTVLCTPQSQPLTLLHIRDVLKQDRLAPSPPSIQCGLLLTSDTFEKGVLMHGWGGGWGSEPQVILGTA